MLDRTSKYCKFEFFVRFVISQEVDPFDNQPPTLSFKRLNIAQDNSTVATCFSVPFKLTYASGPRLHPLGEVRKTCVK